MNIAERLNEFHASYLKTKGYGGRNVLEIELGKKPGYLTTAAKRNTTISSDVIEVIVRKFTDLNIIWLITGEGQMLKEASSSPPASEREAVYKELFEMGEAEKERMRSENKKELENLRVELKNELETLRREKDDEIRNLIVHEAELEQRLSLFTSEKPTAPRKGSAVGAVELKSTGTD